MKLFQEENKKTKTTIAYLTMDRNEEKRIVVALTRLLRRHEDMTTSQRTEHKTILKQFVLKGRNMTASQFTELFYLCREFRVPLNVNAPTEASPIRDQFGDRPALRRVGLMEVELRAKKYRTYDAQSQSCAALSSEAAALRAKRASKHDITLEWVREYCDEVIEDKPEILNDLDSTTKKIEKAVKKALITSQIHPLEHRVVDLESHTASLEHRLKPMREGSLGRSNAVKKLEKQVVEQHEIIQALIKRLDALEGIDQYEAEPSASVSEPKAGEQAYAEQNKRKSIAPEVLAMLREQKADSGSESSEVIPKVSMLETMRENIRQRSA